MTRYYYATTTGRQPVGPVTMEELRELARMGKITSETYVVAEGQGAWVCYRDLGTEQTAPTLPPQPVTASRERGGDASLERATLQRLVHYVIVLIALWIGQSVVQYLPGTDIVLGQIPLGAWLQLAISVAILVLMLLILAPLRIVIQYYVGLLFRVSGQLAARADCQPTVSAAATYTVMVTYVAIIYWSVLPSVLTFVGIFLGPSSPVIKLTKLAVAILGIVLVVRLVLALHPLIGKATGAITDKAMEATEKADCRPCPACGASMRRDAKFCPNCGRKA